MSAREDWWWKFTAVASSGLVLAGALHRGRALRAELAAARRAATRDSLTGLANRAGFTAHTDRLAGPAVVVLVDLDAFKAINDTLGHDTGDAVLVAVADRLRAALAPFGVVARLGGDEFAAVLTRLPHSDVDDWAHQVLTDTANAVAAPLPLADRVLTVGVSAGAAPLGRGGDVALSLHRADTAMYRAKRSGRPVALFDPAYDTDELTERAPLRRRDAAAPAARLWEVAA